MSFLPMPSQSWNADIIPMLPLILQFLPLKLVEEKKVMEHYEQQGASEWPSYLESNMSDPVIFLDATLPKSQNFVCTLQSLAHRMTMFASL